MKAPISKFKRNYAELQDKIKELQKAAQIETQALMKELFDDFFKEHGKITYAIFWRQYTPYFNDGEECTFGVNDICISFTEGSYEDGEGDEYAFRSDREADYREHLAKWEAYEANPQAVYDAALAEHNAKYTNNRYGYNSRFTSFEDFKPTYYEKQELLDSLEAITSGAYTKALADFKEISSVIRSIDDDYMRMIYGDHSKVVYFGPDGDLEVEDYSDHY